MFIYITEWLPMTAELPQKTIDLMMKTNCDIRVVKRFNTAKQRDERTIIRSVPANELMNEYKKSKEWPQEKGDERKIHRRLIRDHIEIKKIMESKKWA